MSISRNRTLIFFDGGCRPNPGMMETAVVVGGKADIRRDIGQGNNSDAEWRALLHAVEIAVALKLDDVMFIGDAMHVVRQAAGDWKCRVPELQQYLADYRAAISAIARVRLRHVPRSKNLAGIALARLHG